MNKTAKNSMIYLSGTVIMGLLGFVNTILLTRVLSSQVYAMYGLLTNFVTAADMLIAFGYDQSYMRFYYDHDQTPKRFLWECMKVPLLLFGVFTLVLLEPGQHLAKYIFADRLGWITLIALAGQVLFSSIHRFTQLTARMGECAGNYVLSNIVSKSGFIGILMVVFLAAGAVSFQWVVLSFMIMAIVSAGINLLAFSKLPKLANPEGSRVRNRELFQYGFPYMINNVLVLIIPVLEKVIIRDLAGWEVLSIFTAASIFQTVVMLVVNTLMNIWNPIVYKHCDDTAVFKPILHTFGMIGTVILCLGTAACILLRRWLVLLLDEKYFAVYVIAPAILLASCFNIISTIYSVGINIKKKTMHFVVAPILQITVSVGLCYWLIPVMGLVGVGIVILTSVGVSQLYRILVGLKLYDTGTSEVKSAAVCVLATAAAVLSLFLTGLAHDIVISLGLVCLMVLVFNKDMIPMAKKLRSLMRP